MRLTLAGAAVAAGITAAACGGTPTGTRGGAAPARPASVRTTDAPAPGTATSDGRPAAPPQFRAPQGATAGTAVHGWRPAATTAPAAPPADRCGAAVAIGSKAQPLCPPG